MYTVHYKMGRWWLSVTTDYESYAWGLMKMFAPNAWIEWKRGINGK